MKRGSGDDPFADTDEEQESDPETTRETASSADSAVEGRREDQTTPGAAPEPTRTTAQSTTQTVSESSTGEAGEDLPYLARRQLKDKSVKSDRDQIPFFLRESVQRGERNLRRAVEDELDQPVGKTDMREAAYVFAQRHPEAVAEVLREWGIEYLE